MTLVDTSAWIEALRTDGREDVRRQVAQLLTAGQAAQCPMVTLELWNGAGGESERAKVKRLVGELPTFEITWEVWTRASELAQASRKRGLTIPATDLVIAATAAVHGLALLHAGRHFELLSDIGEA